jgi:hypothetical protein
MKEIKIIEPEVVRTIFHYKERKTPKKHWWNKAKIYPEGWYERDGLTISTINDGIEFTAIDANDPGIAYICKYGFVIYVDEGKLYARRINFADLNKLKVSI